MQESKSCVLPLDDTPIYNYKTHLRQLTYQLVDLQNTHKIGLEPITHCFTKQNLLYVSLEWFIMPKLWSGWRDSNPQSSAWKADALAITLHPHMVCHQRFELWTPALKGRCSACWASGTYWCGTTDSNHWPLACKASALTSWASPAFARPTALTLTLHYLTFAQI